MSTVQDLIKQIGLEKVTPDDPETVIPPVIEEPAEKVDTPPADIVPPVETPPPPVVDRFKILSDTLGQEFKSDEELTAWKGSLTANQNRLQDYEAREKAWASEKAELEQGVDPRSFFASDAFFNMNTLMLKFPDKNPQVISELVTTDYTDAYLKNPVGTLALDLMLDHPRTYTNRQDAESDILRKYDISDEKDEDGNYIIDAQTTRMMQVEAEKATVKFAGIKAMSDQTKHVDLVAARAEKQAAEASRIQKMTQATEPLFTKIIPEALNEIVFTETYQDEDGKEVTVDAFKYKVGDGYAKSKRVEGALAAIRNEIIRNGTEWTPELEAAKKAEVTDILLATYLYHNKKKIYAAMFQDHQTKFKDEVYMKRHKAKEVRLDGAVVKPNSDEEELTRQQNIFLKSRNIKV